MVWPFSANFLRIVSNFAALLLSRPEVGSSRMIRDGFDTISMAIQTLFFSPPEIPFTMLSPIYVFSHFWSSKDVNNSDTVLSASFLSLIFKKAANSSVSALDHLYTELLGLRTRDHFDIQKCQNCKMFSAKKFYRLLKSS